MLEGPITTPISATTGIQEDMVITVLSGLTLTLK